MFSRKGYFDVMVSCEYKILGSIIYVCNSYDYGFRLLEGISYFQQLANNRHPSLVFYRYIRCGLHTNAQS